MDEIILSVSGQVPSGKNQVGLSFKGGKVHRYPKARFSAWRASFEVQARSQTKVRGLEERLRADVVIRQGDRIRRDVPGQLDALWHALVHCGILADDYWIRSVTFDETLDRQGPGAVIRLTPLVGVW
jgi:Holliday junction resolvase RusA-like endonuclease